MNKDEIYIDLDFGQVVYVKATGIKSIQIDSNYVFTIYYTDGTSQQVPTLYRDFSDILNQLKAQNTKGDELIKNSQTVMNSVAASATAADTSAKNAAASAEKAKKSADASASSAAEAKTHETNAENSATASANSATNSAASEKNAADSAESAKKSATASADSATNSATSESNASGYATAADNSAKDAASSASSASDYASNASTSAGNAAEYAKSAHDSASSASTSESNAATSESNSAKSATDAGASAKEAKASETNAKDSATSALASANNAKTSETNSAASEKKAAASAESARQSAETAASAAASAAECLGIPNGLTTLEKQIVGACVAKRTGKVFHTRIYKFLSNQSPKGVFMDDSVGLKCVPSTDTVEGQDDFEQFLPFQWMRCNYVTDSDGFKKLALVEGMPGYQTTGACDIGVLHPTFYWNVVMSKTKEDWYLSDSPHPELGLVPFCDAVKADNTVMPYFIQSATSSVVASDGLLRSQFGSAPAYNQSYNSMITDYQKKGSGYWGAGMSRQLFWYLMCIIKYGTKNSQSAMRGCSDYSAQVKCAVAETGVKRVLVSSDSPWYAGGCVSVGTANGSSTDRGEAKMNSICNRVRVKSIESVTVNGTAYTALNLDIDSTITTTTDTYVSTMPCWTGETEAVIGHHDGSYLSYTDGRHSLRICGQEYQLGQYIVASDTAIRFSDTEGHKDVYAYPRGVKHVAYAITGAIKVGSIPEAGDYWIGDENVDVSHGVIWPGAKGSGDSVGVGDRCWGGETPAEGELREALTTANLGTGGDSGACLLACWAWLGAVHWAFGSCD